MTHEKKSLEERMKDKGVKPGDLLPFQEPKPEGKKGLEKLYNAKSKGYPQFKSDVDKNPIDYNKGLEEYGFRPLKSGLGGVYDAKSKGYPKLEYDTNKKTERKNEKPEKILKEVLDKNSNLSPIERLSLTENLFRSKKIHIMLAYSILENIEKQFEIYEKNFYNKYYKIKDYLKEEIEKNLIEE